MSARVRRRRGVLLLALALACGALAASSVHGRVEAVERRVGPLVTVAVAARDVPAGGRLTRAAVGTRRVPAAYVPRAALRPGEVPVGARLPAALSAGSYLTAVLLRPAGASSGGALRRGERAVDLAVTGGRGLASNAAPGARVDVLVSTESREGAGRTFLALESAELLAVRPLDGELGGEPSAGGAERSEPDAVATLRVSLERAVYLSAAQNFAREVRLLARPPGDRRRAGRRAVSEAGL